ncbi:hypothetical protein [Emticicia sp. SJ17W-69]|uniref:hypothetical protein n=1 Tax=Emticicia sp. SJ17W-69 TaxID=3421657 RepID=UPI003EBA989F
MILINEIYRRNKLLAQVGTIHLALALLLGIYSIFNEELIMGINSMIKPIKFALSIWVYAWTMGLLLFYINDKKKVKNLSILAVVTMVYEQFAITSQAFRGELSHFNNSSVYGGILYALMGIFIVVLTFQTLRIAITFIRQKTYSIPSPLVLSIQIGLIYFVIFSFFGGYISGVNGHTVGAKDGGAGLPLINWSTTFGDLRVAHFFGIHALQIIPLFGYWVSGKYNSSTATKAIWVFSIIYLIYVCFTMVQAMMGIPFMAR